MRSNLKSQNPDYISKTSLKNYADNYTPLLLVRNDGRQSILMEGVSLSYKPFSINCKVFYVIWYNICLIFGTACSCDVISLKFGFSLKTNHRNFFLSLISPGLLRSGMAMRVLENVPKANIRAYICANIAYICQDADMRIGKKVAHGHP